MNNYILHFLDQNKTTIVEQWINEIKVVGEQKQLSAGPDDNMFVSTSKEFIEIIMSNLNKDKDGFSSKLTDFSSRIIRLGWPLTYVIEGLQAFRSVLLKKAFNEKVAENDYLLVLNEVDQWIDPIISEMISLYSGNWEQTVSLQKVALQELSAPLIPIFEDITIMPLIGTIDTERARQIMENLLQGVVKHRSEVVLIDITGVPVVDTMVAHHIIQAAEAVRLVGAKCLLVGIRPEIAQTIVNLGIDLNQFITKSTLKRGIETALEMTNRKMVRLGVEGLD
ncbi:STAS domain-containing protein [Litchfieldia salsa]|uniref:RsbT co-antagonist protein RsbR n=1 Tax=Litchfieldia salsa TaxID=930152 RepID=A0A1H0WXZ6_9BACI|nr:STAS domain-containing protein [Litchfieldia salsa]SDP95459.1 rsbT co-antagonist protein RsbR [Litchfieldia salsa]